MALFKGKAQVQSKVGTSIKLGSRIRDLISGIEGLALSRTDCLNGNVRYTLQPRSADGVAMPDAFEIDFHNLEVLDAGVSDREVQVAESTIQLGDRVHDIVTGYEGVAILKNTYLNGCVHFYVAGHKDDSKTLLEGTPGGTQFSQDRLRTIKGGIREQLKVPAKGKKPTGGPATRLARPAVHRG